jgi:hypothetical protein
MYIVYMNVTQYLKFRDMRKEAPPYRDEPHLAGLLHRQLGKNANGVPVSYPVLFGGKIRHRALRRELHRTMTPAQRASYGLEVNPLLISGLTLLMAGGRIGAFRQKNLITRGHIVLWFLPVLVGILACIDPTVIPWTFWGGLGLGSLASVGYFWVLYFAVFIGLKTVGKSFEAVPVRDLRMFLYVLIVAPVDEECVYGWILQLCTMVAALATGASLGVAFAAGAIVSALLFAAIHPVTRTWELMLLVISRVMWNVGIVLYGVPAILAVHVVANLLAVFPVWVPVVRRVARRMPGLVVRRGR